MAKTISACWVTAELEKFFEGELRGEIERCRVRLAIAATAYLRKSFTGRIHKLEKLIARKSD